jgi:hypothetical protein
MKPTAWSKRNSRQRPDPSLNSATGSSRRLTGSALSHDLPDAAARRVRGFSPRALCSSMVARVGFEPTTFGL